MLQEIQPSPLHSRRKGKAESSSETITASSASDSPTTRFANGQPPKLAKSISKTSSVQPPSLCYYESYFDDSYVGEFSGDVDADNCVDDDKIEPDLHNWCDESSLNNSILEFGFDSFGPESLLFTGNVPDQNANENVSAANDADNELLSLSVTEPQLRDKVNACFDQSKIRTTYELSVPEPVLATDDNDNCQRREQRTEERGAADDEKMNANNHSASVNGTSAMISELKSANDVSLEVRAGDVSNGHGEGAPVDKNSRPNSSISLNDDKSSSFSRSSTLSRSQRKKISPRLNFDQILNTSDESNQQNVTAALNGGEHSNAPISENGHESLKNGSNSGPTSLKNEG